MMESRSSVTTDDFNVHFLSIPHKTISVMYLYLMFFLYHFVILPLFFLWYLLKLWMMRVLFRSLDPKKAKGVDGIPAQFVQVCPSGMARLVAILLNKCLHSSTFPVLWKRTIFKNLCKILI